MDHHNYRETHFAEVRKPDRNFLSGAIASLEIFIKKQVANRRAWGTCIKVVPPAEPLHPHTVVLEREGVTERFFLKDQDVARFASTGADYSLTTDVRNALNHLEKRTSRKSALRA